MPTSSTNPTTYRVLVIEDMGETVRRLRTNLAPEDGEGFTLEVEFWEAPFDADRIVAHIFANQSTYDCILLDCAFSEADEAIFRAQEFLGIDEIRKRPDQDCPGAIRVLRSIAPTNTIPVVTWTWFDYGGWRDYMSKDLGVEWSMTKANENYNQLKETLRRYCESRTRLRNLKLTTLHGASQAMQHLRERIRQVVMSPANLNIHITGPIGSGKGLIARVLADALRPGRPYVPIDCGTLTQELAATSFGGIRDKFATGVRAWKGHFIEANGGIIFLDEVQAMIREVQPKLLRILEDREVMAGGDSTPTPIDVQVISAASTDVRALARAGMFDSGLSSRLTGLTLSVPPLNDRREDIPNLANHFLDAAIKEERKYEQSLDPSAIQWLQDYDWSEGNCRQLRDHIKAAIATISTRPIKSSDLEDLFGNSGGSTKPPAASARLSLYGFRALSNDSGAIDVRAEMESIHKSAMEHGRWRTEEALAVFGSPTKAQEMLNLNSKQWYDIRNRNRGTPPDQPPV